MPDFQPCGPPASSSLYRAAAAFFLVLAAFRAASLLDAALLAGLGGCLWWVAQRQTSPEAALLAVGFFLALPILPAHPAAPLGIFAMLYTATGVAHALKGPRRKWPPRIALMAGATLFTAAADPPACAAGLLLGSVLSLWLAELRRGILLACFAFWTTLAAGLVFTVHPNHFPMTFRPGLLLFRVPSISLELGRAAPLALALGLCLAVYAARPRSRFYGHTTPLLAAVLLFLVSPAWAIPFALLFLSGLAADMLQSPQGRPWRVSLWLLLALQCTADIAGVSYLRYVTLRQHTAPLTCLLRPMLRSIPSMPDYKVHSVSINGMHCDACVRHVTAELAKVPGVRVHRVEIGKAEVMAEPAVHPRVHAAIESAGFSVPRPNASS